MHILSYLNLFISVEPIQSEYDISVESSYFVYIILRTPYVVPIFMLSAKI